MVDYLLSDLELREGTLDLLQALKVHAESLVLVQVWVQWGPGIDIVPHHR